MSTTVAAAALPRPTRRQRLLAALDRRFAFHSRGNVIAAGVAVALLGGLLSLWLGQDANWDLRNYHLYNGYAALHGRLGIDLAPAQMQSYFNPLLDVLHYALFVGLPAPLAGFAMGVLHALAFLLLAGIVWQVLDPRLDRARLVPWLALAGLCSAAFLSEFAGTMGDNTSALPVLGALLAALHAQRRQQAAGQGVALGWWALAGALLGLAMACKLTNALFALALGVAALVAGGRPRQRIGGAAVLTAVTLLSFALLAGPWLLRVWQTFGNPLFPQFNSHFLAPLAPPVAVSDTRWLPKTLWEWLTWPLQFSLAPNRVSEVRLRQLVWPLLYLLGLVALLRWVLRRPRASAPAEVVAPAWRAVLVFVVVAFLAWQAAFSIQRYLVVPELLAPLLLWVGLRRLLPARIAAPAARWTLIACAAFALYGWGEWGHERWAREAFRVQAPPMPQPERSLVLLVGDAPESWRIPFLPAQAAYASVASNFPETPAYAARVREMLAARGQGYAMLPAEVDRNVERLQRLNAVAARLGLDRGPDCALMRRLAHRPVRAGVEVDAGRCRWVLLPERAVDVAAADRQTQALAAQQLVRYGLALQPGSCQIYQSWVGQARFPYQWCRLQ
ncbi:glycosyltransferase 87 family protein [Xanthomonas sp. LF06-19]|uniref:glycosyltransferase 87 family protein n=1 Tax=Xanthomonas sp. LF06-19 TaxID=3097551 RepID=UPI002A7FC3BD|nr:glycosyltransferase 87 family protein [Xanthomonas sp. LF06-19]MDY4282083.1 glycosyltransferase 87 family protein [Xanthomonas sp. LF06-19]